MAIHFSAGAQPNAEANHPITTTTTEYDEDSSLTMRAQTSLGLTVIGEASSEDEPSRLTLPEMLRPVLQKIEAISHRLLREAENEPGIDSELAPHEGLELGPRFTMRVDRRAALLDSPSTAERGLALDPQRGYAGDDGDYDVYDLSVHWAAFEPGPVELSLLGGVRAIQGVGGMWRTESHASDQNGSAWVSETYDDDISVVMLPILGGGMRVWLTEGVILSTSASTYSSEFSEGFYDVVMETSIRLGEGVGLSAGYQELRTGPDEMGLIEPLSERGLFARLTIEF